MIPRWRVKIMDALFRIMGRREDINMEEQLLQFAGRHPHFAVLIISLFLIDYASDKIRLMGRK